MVLIGPQSFRQKKEKRVLPSSEKWTSLNKLFTEKCKKAKESYYQNIVKDLKESNPGQWHCKLKRMSGHEDNRLDSIDIKALEDLNTEAQAEVIADHYAKIANEYKPINKDDFPNYQGQFLPPVINS